MANTQDGLEWSAEFALAPPTLVGTYTMTDAGTGVFATGCTVPAGVTHLLFVQTSDMGSAAVGLTANCADVGAGSALSYGTSIAANGCIGYGYMASEASAAACAIANITSISASGGTAGDTYDLLVVATAAARTNLAFIRGLRSSEGVTFRNVPLRYDPTDHTKRTRGEKTISFEAPSETGQTGLQAVRDRREWTLILHKDTDGDGTVTETAIYEKVSGSLDKTNPIEGTGEVVDPFTGNYKRRISILSNA